MRYEVVPARLEHLEAVAAMMRQADRDEVWAAMHQSPRDALLASAAASRDAVVGLADGAPICAFGIGQCSALSLRGIPWLLSVEGVERHGLALLKESVKYIKHARERFPRLENHVDARNVGAVRWLRWLGFEVDEPVPFGFEQLPFHRFHWQAE